MRVFLNLPPFAYFCVSPIALSFSHRDDNHWPSTLLPLRPLLSNAHAVGLCFIAPRRVSFYTHGSSSSRGSSRWQWPAGGCCAQDIPKGTLGGEMLGAASFAPIGTPIAGVKRQRTCQYAQSRIKERLGQIRWVAKIPNQYRKM
jgi:hypothetical protein